VCNPICYQLCNPICGIDYVVKCVLLLVYCHMWYCRWIPICGIIRVFQGVYVRILKPGRKLRPEKGRRAVQQVGEGDPSANHMGCRKGVCASVLVMMYW